MTVVRKDAAPPSRREQKKVDKRERIRAAAWKLFTTKGYDATTTKEVAKKARIATGTLFLYASDKQDLLFLVYEQRLRDAVERGFTSMPDDAPLLDQLLAVFRSVFEMYAENMGVAAHFVTVLPGADGPNARFVEGFTLVFLQQIADLVRAGQARGEIDPDVMPLQAASNIFWLYFGVLLMWLRGSLDLERSVDFSLRSALDLQIRGMMPRNG